MHNHIDDWSSALNNAAESLGIANIDTGNAHDLSAASLNHNFAFDTSNNDLNNHSLHNPNLQPEAWHTHQQVFHSDPTTTSQPDQNQSYLIPNDVSGENDIIEQGFTPSGSPQVLDAHTTSLYCDPYTVVHHYHHIVVPNPNNGTDNGSSGGSTNNTMNAMPSYDYSDSSNYGDYSSCDSSSDSSYDSSSDSSCDSSSDSSCD